jgi:hypothetical protein
MVELEAEEYRGRVYMRDNSYLSAVSYDGAAVFVI